MSVDIFELENQTAYVVSGHQSQQTDDSVITVREIVPAVSTHA